MPIEFTGLEDEQGGLNDGCNDGGSQDGLVLRRIARLR